MAHILPSDTGSQSRSPPRNIFKGKPAWELWLENAGRTFGRARPFSSNNARDCTFLRPAACEIPGKMPTHTHSMPREREKSCSLAKTPSTTYILGLFHGRKTVFSSLSPSLEARSARQPSLHFAAVHFRLWELPYMMSAIFSDFFTPSPLSAFGSDLNYKIHVTSISRSAFP